ncbi:MAG: helix-turn-helix domain-containing protein [Alphaproteobacteria bacterium]
MGARVRQLRESRRMPQKELARRLGVSFQQIQKYEKGTNRISASRLWELSGILGVEPAHFFEDLEGSPGAERTEVQGAVQLGGREMSELNSHFRRILSAGVRRQIVQLVRALAGER